MVRTKKCAHKNVPWTREPKRTSYKTFQSTEAAKRYDKFIAKRTFCAEKGFLLTDAQTMGYDECVYKIVSAHHWRQFASHPSAAVVPLVREFYAHLSEESQQTVYVRGVEVPIDRTAINSFYGMDGIEDQHTAWAATVDDEELKTILEFMCVEGTTWNISAQGAMTLPRNSLTADCKLWYHFLKTRLMPSMHIQTVSKDRALLLDSILAGRAIDVGQIINRELYACARKQGGSLWFPCLITGLCIRHGIPILDTEERLSTKGAITTATIA